MGRKLLLNVKERSMARSRANGPGIRAVVLGSRLHNRPVLDATMNLHILIKSKHYILLMK